MGKELLDTKVISLVSGHLYDGVAKIIDGAKTQIYNDREMFAKLSQTLTWSHFTELVTIEDETKRLLCQQMGIELLMLGEDQIKVTQYLTYLPDKQWFVDKLNRSLLIAKEYKERHQSR